MPAKKDASAIVNNPLFDQSCSGKFRSTLIDKLIDDVGCAVASVECGQDGHEVCSLHKFPISTPFFSYCFSIMIDGRESLKLVSVVEQDKIK
jgi:acetoin utilization deacetylase AcuC-like enzyme